MDGVSSPLTERQERVLQRMELLRDLRKPSPWYWVRLVFCYRLRARSTASLWGGVAWTLAWAACFFWLNRGSGHSWPAPTIWIIFVCVPLLIALFDRYIMAPAERKIEAARELLEQEQKNAL